MSTLCYHLQLEINFSAWNQRISLLVINVIEQSVQLLYLDIYTYYIV